MTAVQDKSQQVLTAVQGVQPFSVIDSGPSWAIFYAQNQKKEEQRVADCEIFCTFAPDLQHKHHSLWLNTN